MSTSCVLRVKLTAMITGAPDSYRMIASSVRWSRSNRWPFEIDCPARMQSQTPWKEFREAAASKFGLPSTVQPSFFW